MAVLIVDHGAILASVQNPGLHSSCLHLLKPACLPCVRKVRLAIREGAFFHDSPPKAIHQKRPRMLGLNLGGGEATYKS